MIRILLVDPQEQVRRGLRMRLALEPDLQIVGETGDSAEALGLALLLQPDVLVVDVAPPGLDGIGLVEKCCAQAASCECVVLSLQDDDATRQRATGAGALGFVLKRGDGEELIADIRRVARLRQKSEANPPKDEPPFRPGMDATSSSLS